MEFHDLEIEISKTGKVRVHIQGAKGERCLDYAAFLEEVLGKTESRELTPEYYEPGTKAAIPLSVSREKDGG